MDHIQRKPSRRPPQRDPTTASGASLLQRGLIVLQSALALVLLVGAGMFIQSLEQAARTSISNSTRRTDTSSISTRRQPATPPPRLRPSIEPSRSGSTPSPGSRKLASPPHAQWKPTTGATASKSKASPPDDGASWVKGNAEYFDSVGTRVPWDEARPPRTPPPLQPSPSSISPSSKNSSSLARTRSVPFRLTRPQSPGDFEIVGVVEDTAYTAGPGRTTPCTSSP